ncbi:MAG: hypothetical protein JSS83_17740 [Cyanobacteria bacterium SZAS LIN-3]|nr:hypothetical protein [Cyanobacteria bacterium SZAS LIN-3]
MPAPLHADTLDFSERIRNATSGENSLGQFFDSVNKTVDHAVEQRMKHGDYVPPPNQPTEAAAASQAVEEALGHGFGVRDDGFTRYGGGMDAYVDKARTVTQDIDIRECRAAKEHWAALSPSEQKVIEYEKQAREQYEHLMIFHIKDAPPATPHLDAFTKAVQHTISPLEKERDTRLHKIWQELPAENKARIYRSIEEHKHFRAL